MLLALGLSVEQVQAPKERLTDAAKVLSSLRDSELLLAHEPSLERLGYSRSSLRDEEEILVASPVLGHSNVHKESGLETFQSSLPGGDFCARGRARSDGALRMDGSLSEISGGVEFDVAQLADRLQAGTGVDFVHQGFGDVH